MSDSAVEIRFGADLADLERGTADAVALLTNAAGEMADAFAPRSDWREADEERRIADAKIAIEEDAALKSIAIEEDRNNFLYRMGEQSLDQWKAQAGAEENAKYAAELAWLDRKTAADRGNAEAEARDLEERALLYQDHVLALQKLDEQYAEKKRAIGQQELQDTVKTYQDELKNQIAALDAELKAHQITDQQKYDQEVAYINQTKALVEQAYSNAQAGMNEESAAFQNLKKQELAAEQQFVQQANAANNQLVEQESAKWTQLGNSIKSSFNSAIDGMLFEGKTFEQGMLTIAQGVLKAFLTMAENIAENWIETQISSLFVTKSTQTVSAVGQITDNAAVAASGAFAATAAIPYVGPALAPGAAAAAFAEAMSWTAALSFAVGAWEIPRDMRANLHAGEMVVPANFASGLRANGGGLSGGGDVNMNYSPTINAREPASLKQMLVTESSEMVSWLNRQLRNGALRA